MSELLTVESTALARGLEPRPDDLPAGRVEELAGELIEFYRRIRVPDEELPEPFRAGGEWKRYVDERAWFYDALLEGDDKTVSEALRSFWRNGLGPIVSQYAYYTDIEQGDEQKAERFLTRLTEDFEHWKDLWGEDPSVLEVPTVGNPWGLELDGVLVTPLALRFDTHARQIAELLRDIDDPVVAEIGGGYGGMAHRAITRAPEVSYVDFDLPETLVLAAFYLKATMPDSKVQLWEKGMPLGRGELREHSVVLAPHYAFAEVEPLSLDLLLNAFSLSEMRPETMSAYIGMLPERCRGYFLQNNVDRVGVVNRGFERTPCSEYPIDKSAFKTVYFKFDTFQGPAGDYRESLHQRIGLTAE